MPRQHSALRTDNEPGLFTRPFLLLCATMFLGYSNQALLTPTIPLYVDHLGGSAFVAGCALLAFSVPSFAIRPYIGMLADRWNAAAVLAGGLVLLALGSTILVAPLLALVFVGAVLRGLGWAGLNTGGYTTLALTAPEQRRGEAAGYYTSVTASASVVLPALALWMIGSGGYFWVFVLSAALPLAGLPLALRPARAAPASRSRPQSDAAPGGLIDRGVLLATGLNLCATLVMPSVMAFVPLYARSLGVEHIGWFYVLAGLTNILARPALGRRSDAMGRGPAIGLGFGAQCIGLALIVAASDVGLLLTGGVFVALGSSLVGSTTTALAMDLADPARRGQAMASFSISFQIGGGAGAILSGALADLVGFRGMYLGSICITLGGLALLAAARKSLPRPAR